jgi:hypothetical protein
MVHRFGRAFLLHFLNTVNAPAHVWNAHSKLVVDDTIDGHLSQKRNFGGPIAVHLLLDGYLQPPFLQRMNAAWNTKRCRPNHLASRRLHFHYGVSGVYLRIQLF